MATTQMTNGERTIDVPEHMVEFLLNHGWTRI